MPQDTPASCAVFLRLCQLTMHGNDIGDLVHRLQTLSLEYKQATGGRAIEDDALKAILIQQAWRVAEYRAVIQRMSDEGQLTDYYSVATALHKRWNEMR